MALAAGGVRCQHGLMKTRRNLLRSLIGSLASGYPFRRTAAAAEVQLKSKQALSGALDGMEASIVEVTFAPGAVSTEHRHPGFIAGYVLEGKFRFGVEGQKEQILGPGETFFEAARALHTIGASALPDKPAKILAFSVAPIGSPAALPK